MQSVVSFVQTLLSAAEMMCGSFKTSSGGVKEPLRPSVMKEMTKDGNGQQGHQPVLKLAVS